MTERETGAAARSETLLGSASAPTANSHRGLEISISFELAEPRLHVRVGQTWPRERPESEPFERSVLFAARAYEGGHFRLAGGESIDSVHGRFSVSSNGVSTSSAGGIVGTASYHAAHVADADDPEDHGWPAGYQIAVTAPEAVLSELISQVRAGEPPARVDIVVGGLEIRPTMTHDAEFEWRSPTETQLPVLGYVFDHAMPKVAQRQNIVDDVVGRIRRTVAETIDGLAILLLAALVVLLAVLAYRGGPGAANPVAHAIELYLGHWIGIALASVVGLLGFRYGSIGYQIDRLPRASEKETRQAFASMPSPDDDGWDVALLDRHVTHAQHGDLMELRHAVRAWRETQQRVALRRFWWAGGVLVVLPLAALALFSV